MKHTKHEVFRSFGLNFIIPFLNILVEYHYGVGDS